MVAPAAWQLVLSSSCPVRRALAPAFLVALGALFEGSRPEPTPPRLASRGSALLYFVWSCLGAGTEDILCSWSAASSRAIQASAL